MKLAVHRGSRDRPQQQDARRQAGDRAPRCASDHQGRPSTARSASRTRPSSCATAAMPGSTCSTSPSKKQKPFDEVKDEVKTAHHRQRSARASSPSSPTSSSSGPTRARPMAALATEAGGAKVETTPPFTRTTEPQGMPQGRRRARLHARQGQGRLGARRQRQVAHRLQGDRDHAGAGADQGAARHASPSELKNELADETLSEYVRRAAEAARHAHQRGRVQARHRRPSTETTNSSRLGPGIALSTLERKTRSRPGPMEAMPPLADLRRALRRGRRRRSCGRASSPISRRRSPPT